jgi:hypothetical protein
MGYIYKSANLEPSLCNLPRPSLTQLPISGNSPKTRSAAFPLSTRPRSPRRPLVPRSLPRTTRLSSRLLSDAQQSRPIFSPSPLFQSFRNLFRRITSASVHQFFAP